MLNTIYKIEPEQRRDNPFKSIVIFLEGNCENCEIVIMSEFYIPNWTIGVWKSVSDQGPWFRDQWTDVELAETDWTGFLEFIILMIWSSIIGQFNLVQNGSERIPLNKHDWKVWLDHLAVKKEGITPLGTTIFV